ncbi:MAG: hypothetical protein C4306_08235 [Thermoleophilia bacterium]
MANALEPSLVVGVVSSLVLGLAVHLPVVQAPCGTLALGPCERSPAPGLAALFALALEGAKARDRRRARPSLGMMSP